jgi:solute carrier family 10 (sodium/bile acid cotransporter), member 7
MTLADLEARLRRVGLDRYLMALMLTVVLAALFPARGDFAAFVSQLTYGAVSLLFFLYGAKLSLEATLAGLANWRLQVGCLAATFVLFPLLSLGVQSVSLMLLPPAIAIGFLYIGCLPSTVQSSIAFTSVANGNVAGAVCAASVSNLIGVVLSPLLLALLLHRQGGDVASGAVILKIAKQILLPFVLGQLCRPVLAGFLNRNKLPLMIVDRGSILLIIYSAFSAGVVGGIWHLLSPLAIVAVIGLCMALLAVAGLVIVVLARLAGLAVKDRVALLFCGSTKSLATGLPMAGILFAKTEVALIILPLMLFHLLQLVVMAVISRRAEAL